MLPFELTKDTPYLALSGELWSVFYEYFNRNWSCYKGFLLYHILHICPSYTAMKSITRPLKQRAFHAINNPDTHFVEGYEVVLLLVSDNFL